MTSLLYYFCPADELGAYVIFISTDYVFDGTKPPYKPGDPTCPLNKYGMSKADGEKVVLTANAGKHPVIVLIFCPLQLPIFFLGSLLLTSFLFFFNPNSQPLSCVDAYFRTINTLCANIDDGLFFLIIESNIIAQCIPFCFTFLF